MLVKVKQHTCNEQYAIIVFECVTFVRIKVREQFPIGEKEKHCLNSSQSFMK